MPSKTRSSTSIDCPCGSEHPFEQCCRPFIYREQQPATAQALMRARYSAHATAKVLGDVAIDFLWDTWEPAKTSKGDKAEIKSWALSCKWLSLNIIDCYQGGSIDSFGRVNFEARFKQQGRLLVHKEHSIFEKRDGEWRYIDQTPLACET